MLGQWKPPVRGQKILQITSQGNLPARAGAVAQPCVVCTPLSSSALVSRWLSAQHTVKNDKFRLWLWRWAFPWDPAEIAFKNVKHCLGYLEGGVGGFVSSHRWGRPRVFSALLLVLLSWWFPSGPAAPAGTPLLSSAPPSPRAPCGRGCVVLIRERLEGCYWGLIMRL